MSSESILSPKSFASAEYDWKPSVMGLYTDSPDIVPSATCPSGVMTSPVVWSCAMLPESPESWT